MITQTGPTHIFHIISISIRSGSTVKRCPVVRGQVCRGDCKLHRCREIGTILADRINITRNRRFRNGIYSNENCSAGRTPLNLVFHFKGNVTRTGIWPCGLYSLVILTRNDGGSFTTTRRPIVIVHLRVTRLAVFSQSQHFVIQRSACTDLSREGEN